ncbi:MAG TPA: limonene-1,2-epoxide hydrolase family protein [Pararhizobium sp.]|uniref:limonene-1,2-epoxide hydrolase family protein n=1 Tax=Pararhizobium sp. TaxID=1977563 RepID=UPI002C990CD1|nr:limonene-1,2-epoxide hydrolase family protein [Pararhizobium sp.]HTO32301.1 limonene-1,2-epoxide hydrolase family protein [Pararhizobium sp.]
MSMEQLVRNMFDELFVTPEKFFNEDSEFFMWGPAYPPLVGPQAMLQGFTDLAARLTDVSIDYLDFAEKGDIVFVERTDHFTIDGKHKIDLPVVGKGKVGADGKFIYWRDFWDVELLTKANLHPDGAGVLKQ